MSVHCFARDVITFVTFTFFECTFNSSISLMMKKTVLVGFTFYNHTNDCSYYSFFSLYCFHANETIIIRAKHGNCYVNISTKNKTVNVKSNCIYPYPFE